ncbi:MAG: hypothetical protein WC845_03765 [Candidatus Staskawiczbacteria bacterium]
MMYFALLMDILYLLTIVFYLVFLGLVYYWHEKKVTYVLVPVIFTFQFFLIGFLVVIALSLLLEYVPQFF